MDDLDLKWSMPTPIPCNIVSTDAANDAYFIGRGSRFANPFSGLSSKGEGDAAKQFTSWIQYQPELVNLVRRELANASARCDCGDEDCHGLIYQIVTEGSYDVTGLTEEPVFVFGSNEAGRHGKGAALFAKRHYGARQFHGKGLSGRSYAIPTKDAYLSPLPMWSVKEGFRSLQMFATQNPHIYFRLTRVGCGLAGFPEPEILDIAAESTAPNILLPGVWRKKLNPELRPRVSVVAPDGFTFGAESIDRLDTVLSTLDTPRIVTDGSVVGGAFEAYAVLREMQIRRIPALYEFEGCSADVLRNWRAAWYSTHLVAFWDGRDASVKRLIDISKESGLKVRVLDCRSCL